MILNLEEEAQKLVLNHSMSSRAIARAVNKPYSTLMRELNPNDGGAKLGADTFVRIMKVTGDTRPLEEIARFFGKKLVPLEDDHAR